jgi:intracellular septation protein
VSTSVVPPRALPPALKFALEVGPLALFFLSYWKFNIFVATAVMMASVLVTLIVSYWKLKRLPIMPLVTAAMVLIFGALTLYFNDSTFIKVKVTIINGLFALALFVGLALKKPTLQVMFDGALHLTEEGWRKLTWRWAFFFVFLAVLNEVVWRNLPEHDWALYKSFGALPLTVIFALAQAPLIARHEAKSAEATDAF